MESGASSPGNLRLGRARRPSLHQQTRAADKQKSGTGGPLHTKEPVTVASFRTWRGWRENVARNRCLTLHLSKGWSKTGKAAPTFSTIIETRLAASRHRQH